MGLFIRWTSFGCLMYSMLQSPISVASVSTDPLGWHADNLVEGLQLLQHHFLASSVQNDTEYVGGILQDEDGRYRFTMGKGDPGQNTVTFRVRYSKSSELVGFWHTHGETGPNRDRFSPADVALVRETGKPFYLITAQGRLLVLTPAAAERSSGLRTRQSAGRTRASRGSHPGTPLLTTL